MVNEREFAAMLEFQKIWNEGKSKIESLDPEVRAKNPIINIDGTYFEAKTCNIIECRRCKSMDFILFGKVRKTHQRLKCKNKHCNHIWIIKPYVPNAKPEDEKTRNSKENILKL